jgi:N-acetylmuramoyl-L-alanine amidase
MGWMRRYGLVLLSLLLAGGAIFVAWRVFRALQRTDRRASSATTTGAARWPDRSVELRLLGVSFPADFGQRRVLLDPGHGALGNRGNLSCSCEPEQDYTLELGQELARQLESTGHFEVRSSRLPGELVDYASRVQRAGDWQADVFLSLHSDVRGRPERLPVEAGQSCQRANEEPGYAVLWSDEAPPELAFSRRRLARALAMRLGEAGLWPYEGIGYREQYQGDPAAPGLFLDRHTAGQRIFVLRAPTMPSVIVETHNAWNELEARRWREPATRQAFGAAVAVALVDALASARP